MRTFALLLVVAAAAQAAILRNGVELPYYSTVCNRNEPAIDACLKESVQKLLKTISKDGIRPLGITSLDPWNVEEIDMNLGRDQSFKLGLKFQDVNTYGLSKLEVLEVRSNLDDPERITLEFDFYNKKVYTEGKYQAEGTISTMPIVAKGEFNMSIGDIKGVFKMQGHIIQKNGAEHLQIDTATMFPEPGTFEFAMTNDKYPELSNLLVALMNANWRYINAAMQEYSGAMFDRIIRPKLNLAFLKVPFDQIIKGDSYY